MQLTTTSSSGVSGNYHGARVMIYAEQSRCPPRGQFSEVYYQAFSSQFYFLSQPNLSLPDLHPTPKPGDPEGGEAS